jgi:3-dehydroquinate dehydratase II
MEKNMKILVINGPNINFLGIRDKAIYGKEDFNYLINLINEKAEKEGIIIDTFQSNTEGTIIDRIQEAYFDGTQGIIINPGAYTHYSYAIRDALASMDMPKIEVHISNVHKREEFRHVSVTAAECTGQIVGLGLKGYVLAVDAILSILQG